MPKRVKYAVKIWYADKKQYRLWRWSGSVQVFDSRGEARLWCDPKDKVVKYVPRKRSKTHHVQKLVKKCKVLELKLLHVTSDLERAESIIDGSWPNADNVIANARIGLGKKS